MTWLSVLALVVALVLAVGLAFTLRVLGVLQRRTRELRVEVAALTPVPALSPDLEASFGRGDRRLIVIEILNHLEIAGKRVKLGGVAGSLAPETVRRLVVDEAAKEVMEQLASEGVEATVTVHAAR
jgi:hypothetical protein